MSKPQESTHGSGPEVECIRSVNRGEQPSSSHHQIDDMNKAETESNISATVAPMPTAEEHAKQLSSMFNVQSVANPELHDETGHSLESTIHFASTPTQSNRNSTLHINESTHTATVNDIRIGSGNDTFEIKISIEKCQDLFQLLNISSDTSPNRAVWLSYRFFGTVIQSDIFTLSQAVHGDSNFVPMKNSFRLRSSLSELGDHLSSSMNGTLNIHVCTEGEVLGTASVDLNHLIVLEMENGSCSGRNRSFDGRMMLHECTVKPRSRDIQVSSARVAARLCIDRVAGDSANAQLQPPPAIYSSTSSQTANAMIVNRASSPIRSTATPKKDPVDHDDTSSDDSIKHVNAREQQLTARETELSKKEKEIYEAITSLEKKRHEWEQWRHRQELEWHEQLRSKEAAMMRVVEERVCTMEKGRLSCMEASKNEYEKLEGRLRKALIEVEARERQLKDIELNYNNERTRKLAELTSKEKLMKEELKHTVEIERAKVNAAVEQAVQAEKSAAAANKKVKQVEDEMDKLREQHRKTPEVTLMHQVAELKGQVADYERRMGSMTAENNRVTAEKEQFRSNVHKLARALRQERDKAMAKRESNNQQVRLSYDANEKSFVLGGEQGEVHRILGDLSKLSQVKGPTTMSTPVMNRVFDNTENLTSCRGGAQNSNAPPAPSPPPVPPNFGAQTPSSNLNNPGYQYESCTQGTPSLDLSDMIATQG